MKSKRSTSSRADSPANLFRLRVGGKLKPIRVGSGRSSYASCLKYDPASSSWRTYPDSSIEGWPASSVIFPRAGTMLNGVAYRRPMSVRRTSGNGSLSWPTPNVRDYKDVGENTNYEKIAQKSKLAGVVMVRMWPTPKGSSEKFGRPRPNDRGDLQAAVIRWPTPTARLGEQRGAQAKRYSDPKRSNDLDDAVAAAGITGQLNADWVSLLMGFPADWTVVDGSAASSESSKARGTE